MWGICNTFLPVHQSSFVATNNVVAVHYNTFDAIKIDQDQARFAYQMSGLNFFLPQIGETIEMTSAG